MRKCVPILPAILVFIFPLAAAAGHYGIEATRLMDESLSAKVAAAGIVDTKQLWESTRTQSAQKKLARRLGVDVREVARWHNFCDLLRLDGVGPKIARLMTAAGIENLAGLAVQEPGKLLPRLKASRAAVPELGKFPDETNLGYWIHQADELVTADRKSVGKKKRPSK